MDTKTDVRLTPLYTLKDTAWFFNVPESSLVRWARKEVRPGSPLITHYDKPGRYEPEVPFIGAMEAYVIAAFRQHNKGRLKMRYVLEVLAKLGRTHQIAHVLADRRLAFHGHDLLIDVAAEDASTREFVEALTENRVLDKVVEGHLQFIDYGGDGLAERLVLPYTSRPLIELNPRRAFGHPVYIKGWARMEDVLDRWHAGEHPEVIAKDFGLEEAEVLDTIRAISQRASSKAA